MSTFLDANEISRRFGQVPGVELKGWLYVGLPIFTLKIRLILLAKKPISPIDEFILRGLDTCIDNNLDLAEFLGLDLTTVENRLSELHGSEMISVDPGCTGERIDIRLTARGRDVAKKLAVNEVLEQSVPMWINGLTRKPYPYRQGYLLSDGDCSEQGIVPLPPIPARKPKQAELKLDELTLPFRTYWQRNKDKENVPDILGVRSVEKEGRLMFEPAILLEYDLKSSQGRMDYSFIVEGERRDDYDKAFEELGGAKKIARTHVFNKFLVGKEALKEFMPDALTASLGDWGGVFDLLSNVEAAENEIQAAEESEDQPYAPDDTRQRQATRIQELEAELAGYREKLSRVVVRPLRTNDCDKLLKESIRSAKQRLVIVSGTMSKSQAASLLPEIERTLAKSEVEVWLGYGMGGVHGRGKSNRETQDFKDVLTSMKQLQSKYPSRVRIADWGNSHTKILLCDDDYVAVGSYNWLSHKPLGRNVMLEHAFQVTVPSAIEWFAKECEGKFNAPNFANKVTS